ncbi:MAG: outer membrane beta-barrel protein [Myxococcota bacterium]
MPVQVDKSAEGQLPQLVNDVVLTAVQNIGTFEVIGQDDVNALIGFEKQKDLVGCDDASCLADIGGALGVDRIFVMKVARVGEEWVTTIKIINIREARVEGRSSEFTAGNAKALLLAMPQIVTKVLGTAGGSAAAQSSTTSTGAGAPSTPATSPTSAPVTPAAPAPVSDGDDRFGRGLMIGLNAAGATGGSLDYTYSDDTSSLSYGLDSSGAARFFAEYWFTRVIAVGLSYHHIGATLDCSASECGDDTDRSWTMFSLDVAAGWQLLRKLKLYGRLGLGTASQAVPQSYQDAADSVGMTVDTSSGFLLNWAAGALWQPWRHIGIGLELAQLRATSSLTLTYAGVSAEETSHLSQTQIGLTAALIF